MPTIALKDVTVRSLDAEVGQIDHWDTVLRGFGVRVSAQGRKTWVVRYRVHGRQRRLTLGTYPSLGGTCQESCVCGGDHAASSKRVWNMALSWWSTLWILRAGDFHRPSCSEDTVRPSFSFRVASEWK